MRVRGGLGDAVDVLDSRERYVCSRKFMLCYVMLCARLGARARAWRRAHVAALEGSRVAVYESAVCIVLQR